MDASCRRDWGIRRNPAMGEPTISTDLSTPLTNADVSAVRDKLAAWAASLPVREQAGLVALLTAGDTDVSGYMEPVQAQTTLYSMLNNVANLRHELLKGIVNNLRA